ncbi:hypothetical protein J7E50_06845 [Pedobacter sp. ISL-68]|uniref:hypothetical protein n=1 Tax=unclassified Pedobacter TaxID=2628915 RepID=UPI001BEAF2B0|nr:MULTISPECIES: hypothetical protein [unclassified Pedobacter]MBT2564395.1 hypothetical protein [Pedobacter sp. ISL-64]MBT2589929.1 hypothetical protein [Pedobacter sp. ISL-68]
MEIKRILLIALLFCGAIGSSSGQAINISNDQYHLYGPNSTWSQYLQVGGNGQVTDHAFVAVTNGNLHLDSRAGFGTYINYYNQGNTFINPQGGNVGIGTTFPTTKFEVMQATSGWTMNSRVNATTVGEINGLKFYSGYIGDDKWAGIASISESLHSNKTGLGLYSGMTERVRISGDGNVGIGTTFPSTKFEVMQPTSGWTMNSRVNATSVGEINGFKFYSGYIGDDKWAGIASISESLHSNKTGLALYSGMTERLRISGDGNVGIGTTTPAGLLHLSGTYASIDGGNNYQYSGTGLIVQANTGGRTLDKGAQIEFVVPAAADGGNMWGQGRIITVAGNAFNNDATGKMILGTRRMFDKKNVGQQWFYGDDIVIDGVGNIGIGTLTPKEKLSVFGTVRAVEVKVESTGWPDYVFAKDYKTGTLKELEAYIKTNQHLPEIPSAEVIEKEGLALGEMNKKLLKNLEELTLHVIDQNKQLMEQNKKIDGQNLRIAELEKKMDGKTIMHE